MQSGADEKRAKAANEASVWHLPQSKRTTQPVEDDPNRRRPDKVR
jgi:hypothetical protein